MLKVGKCQGFPHISDNATITQTQLLAALRDPHILECTLYNASYVASFTYVNGNQNVKVESLEHLNDVWFLASTNGQEPFTTVNHSTTNSHLPSSGYNTTLVENFSYQSVMGAFGSIMVGNIANLLDEENLDTTELNTTVMMTPLSDTKELSFLTQE